MSIYEYTKGKKVDVDYETGYHLVIEYLGRALQDGRGRS